MILKRLFLLLILVLAGAQITLAQDSPGLLTVDGTERSYYLSLPPDFDPAQPPPLLIALHPTAASGRTMAVLTGLDQRDDFIVAFPNSADLTWNEKGEADGADDTAFIRALVADLTETYNPSAVYLTGFGGGALMAYRTICQAPELFTGVAIVGSLMWDYHQQNCPEAADTTLDVLIIHGTADVYYPSETHETDPQFYAEISTVYGLGDTLGFWAARNGCDDQPGSEAIITYTGCNDDVRVVGYEIAGGGHNWPRVGDDYRLNQFGVDATALITAFFNGDEDWPPALPAAFTGTPRTYTFYVPASYDPAQPTPLVVGLHGRFGTGAAHASLTDFNTLAEEHGFIALYPDGLSNDPTNPTSRDTGWNYLNGIVNAPGPDDTTFITDLIADMSLDLNIDPTRIYVNGMSNGGFMVHRLACEVPQQFAAYADVAGSGFFGIDSICAYDNPVPMLIIHGTADNNILWDGLTNYFQGREIFVTSSIPDLVSFWAERSSCEMDADREDIPPQGNSPDTEVRILRFKGCVEGSATVLYGIVGGGHNWPGMPDKLPESVAGRVNMDINASQEIWEFFQQYTQEA